MRHWPITETSTWQHKTLTRDRHSSPGNIPTCQPRNWAAVISRLRPHVLGSASLESMQWIIASYHWLLRDIDFCRPGRDPLIHAKGMEYYRLSSNQICNTISLATKILVRPPPDSLISLFLILRANRRLIPPIGMIPSLSVMFDV
jgi:hypothetical protein